MTDTGTQDAGTQPEGGATDEGKEQEPTTFTQEDVDRIVKERVKRVEAKYADYNDLKTKAGEKATAEERIAALEQEIQTTRREAMRRRVQAAHRISDEDADLFLTGTDEDSLNAQAKRLSERDAERKQKNNVSPREGTNPTPASDDSREFVRGLFQRANAD